MRPGAGRALQHRLVLAAHMLNSTGALGVGPASLRELFVGGCGSAVVGVGGMGGVGGLCALGKGQFAGLWRGT